MLDKIEMSISGDANYITKNKCGYCLACGSKITDGEYCDFECRMIYFAEVWHDIRSIVGVVY